MGDRWIGTASRLVAHDGRLLHRQVHRQLLPAQLYPRPDLLDCFLDDGLGSEGTLASVTSPRV
jgi:hypothetical protein